MASHILWLRSARLTAGSPCSTGRSGRWAASGALFLSLQWTSSFRVHCAPAAGCVLSHRRGGVSQSQNTRNPQRIPGVHESGGPPGLRAGPQRQSRARRKKAGVSGSSSGGSSVFGASPRLRRNAGTSSSSSNGEAKSLARPSACEVSISGSRIEATLSASPAAVAAGAPAERCGRSVRTFPASRPPTASWRPAAPVGG